MCVLWRRPLAWAAILAAATAALCFVPLFDVLGYELSLALALLASLGSGLVAAAYPQRVRDQLAPFPGARWTVLRLYSVVLGLGLGLLALPLALSLLNALRVRNCDIFEGLAFFLLGPVASVAVATACGLAAGLLAPGRRGASVLWLLGWAGAIGLQLYLVWATPSVRALGSMHGYFSGVLYDEAVSIGHPFVTLRLRDAVLVAAVLATSSALVDRSRLRLSLRASKQGRRGILVAALALVCASAVALWLGGALGHRRTAADVARALGGRVEHDRCVLVYPEQLDRETAELLARDCAFRLEQVEAFFRVRLSEPLVAYLFEDAAAKQELIGAGQTSVAKPWRREVYVQGASFPHPVLRHEIAHVVAGEFGPAPLRVAGRLGGLLPSPGLIEGAAVAADWSDGELTAHEWSHAMREVGVAPSLAQVMGIGFLGVNPSRAYVLAGSFSRFLVDDRGPALFRKAYRTGDIEGAYGEPLEELERGWVEHLESIRLGPGDLELARERFDRPAIFAKVCAHEVAQLRERASRCEERSRWPEALALRGRIVGFSNDAPRARLELARTLVSAGERRRARGLLDPLVDDEAVPPAVRRAARHLRADLDWAQGRDREALVAYRLLLEEPDGAAARRMLAVKVSGLTTPGAAPHLRRFLLGGEGGGPEAPDLALLTLAELVGSVPSWPLGHYLLGRQLWLRDEHERAVPYLERAGALGIDSPLLEAERVRILGASLFRIGDIDSSRRAFADLARDVSLPSGLRTEAADWVERCEWERARQR